MNWWMIYAQVYRWLGVPSVLAGCCRSIRFIAGELAVFAIGVVWVLVSPVLGVFGMFYPGVLLRFLQWARN